MSAMFWMSLLIAAPLSELPRSEREVLAVVVRAPGLTGEHRAETLDAVREGLEAHTGFRIEDASEYLRESDEPLVSIARAVGSAHRRSPPLVLALSILEAPGSGADQVTWQLIRAKEAISLLMENEAVGAAAPDLSRFVEAFDLFEVEAADAMRLRDELLAGLEAPLRAGGYWREQGTLIVKLPADGFSLRLADRSLALEAAEAEIQDVQAGLRELALEHQDFEALTETVRIEPNQTTTWSPQPVDRRLSEARTPRAAVLVSGLGLLVAGGVFLAIAAAQASDDTPRCFVLPGEPTCAPEESSFARLGPVPTAPLGYSLALTGGVLAGGVLVSEETAAPWWWTALGVGLGVAAFSVSVLAD